jgi:hypothetical protein
MLPSADRASNATAASSIVTDSRSATPRSWSRIDVNGSDFSSNTWDRDRMVSGTESSSVVAIMNFT